MWLHCNHLFCWISLVLSCSVVLVSCSQENDSALFDNADASSGAVSLENGWGRSIPVTITLSSQLAADNSNLPSYISNAIKSWNKAVGRTLISLNAAQTIMTGNDFTSCNGYDRVYWPLCDNTQGVYFDRKISSDSTTTGWTYNTGKSSSTLATTIWIASHGTILKADMRFDRDYFKFGNTKTDSNVVEDGRALYIVDMESVALHELGHLLGLGHVDEADSVMQPYLPVGPDSSSYPTTRRCLSSADVSRIRSIYPGGSAAQVCP